MAGAHMRRAGHIAVIVGLVAASCAGGDDGFRRGIDGLAERPSNPTCVAFPKPSNPSKISLEDAYPNVQLRRTTAIEAHPEGGWLATTKEGRLWAWEAREDATARVVLDLRDRVDSRPNEAGLLGLAVHPDFASNGWIFLSYTLQTDEGLTSRISRMTSSEGLAELDPTSEVVVLEQRQPYGNHNGGHIAFGLDGNLYIGFGDGGSAGDPLGAGQDTNTWLGKILRVDVTGAVPYGVPDDNPFVAGGGLPEIYAWGLRNPWKFAFDPETGELWAADVGQNAMEEVDRIELGGNYGWNKKEGSQCYRSEPCDGAFIDPVAEYPHSEGRSVTGGVVVRGGKLPSLEGRYLFADFQSGKLWATGFDSSTGQGKPDLLIPATGIYASTFGRSESGDVLVADYNSGSFYRLSEQPGGEVVQAPQVLSATGCSDPDEVTEPSTGLIPYVPAHTFWSDGADKRRWMGLPDGSAATLDRGRLIFPQGSVLRKDFIRGGERISTRLMVHHPEGWAGYVYRWRADGSDADLVDGLTDEAAGGMWHFPSQAACVQCHTEASGRALGLEVRQLAHPIDYGDGAMADQLTVLSRIGVVDGLPSSAEPYPSRNTTGREAARAWLHVNCASCHQPEASSVALDLRYDTPLEATGLCDAPERGDLGVAGGKLLSPGEPQNSILIKRIKEPGVWRMPPVGSLQVDEVGVGLIETWIAELERCDG